MKKLIINSNVFIWRKGNDVMLYNSGSFKSLILRDVHPCVISFCEHLADPDNLYELPIRQDSINTHEVNDLIQSLISNGFGRMVDENVQIVSLPPILNIQSEIKKAHGELNEDALLEYFTDLTIYIGGGDIQYPNYFRQTYYPVQSESRLSNETMMTFLRVNRTPYLHNLLIVISLVDAYTYEFLDFLISYGVSTTVYVIGSAISDVLAIKEHLASSDISLCIICLGNAEQAELYYGTDNCRFHFLVRSDAENEQYQSDIEKYGITDYAIIPIYDDNLEFFENNVFLSEEDIRSSKLVKRHIFMNQSVNSNFFGSLTIMPDKKIYSNVKSSNFTAEIAVVMV